MNEIILEGSSGNDQAPRRPQLPLAPPPAGEALSHPLPGRRRNTEELRGVLVGMLDTLAGTGEEEDEEGGEEGEEERA